jgi:hypothetical protein
VRQGGGVCLQPHACADGRACVHGAAQAAAGAAAAAAGRATEHSAGVQLAVLTHARDRQHRSGSRRPGAAGHPGGQSACVCLLAPRHTAAASVPSTHRHHCKDCSSLQRVGGVWPAAPPNTG